MEEFEPKKKNNFGKLFYFKYVYVIIAGLVVFLLGRSYSLTFFKQNYKVAEGSLSTASVTIELDGSESSVSSSINATGLKKNKPLVFSKSIVIENTSNFHGYYNVNLTRTSGLNLTDMEYAIFINGVIKEISDVPSDGLILSSTIMAGETDNIEVRLWPKSDYTGNETTFVGDLTVERHVIPMTGSYYIDNGSLTSSNNYVYFNCTNKVNSGSNCEKWRIVEVSDDRLVLTTDTYYGTIFTNSNLFNTSLVLNDYSLVTSMSTDNHAVYLKKTTEITGGDGTINNPYILSSKSTVPEYNFYDDKIIGYITYDNSGVTTTQPIYSGRDNYISHYLTVDGFQGWSTTDGGAVAYHLGDIVNFNSNTTLYAVIKNYLSQKIMNLCNDSSIDYVKPYTSDLGTTMDTYDGRGTEDVCYYTSTTSANLAGQNGNVLFGNYCWQIVRTTDTGGIKLIYNGPKTADDKCTSDSDANYSSNPRPTSVGVIGTTGTNSSQKTSMSGSKTYGAKFEIINESGTDKFHLLNTFSETWGDSTYTSLIGKYVCGTASSVTGDTDTCTVMYYIGHYQDATHASTEKYTIGNVAHYSQIGTSSYNAYSDSPALVGYMYNDVYNYISKSDFTTSNNVINADSTSSSTAYYYGDKATWNPSTHMYDLTVDDGNGNDVTPTTTRTWSSIRSSAMGKYTCRSSTDTSCAIVYYIVTNATSTTMYSISLQNEETYTKTVTWTYGTDFTKSGNDYVLTNPDTVTISLKDWYTNYSNAAYKNIYVCADFTSNTCSEMYYITSTSNYQITYNTSVNSYIFGNSVDYQNGYTILNTNTQEDTTRYQKIWDWYKKYNTINNSHYTCFNTVDNTCGSSVYYVYYTDSTYAYYIELKNGKKVEDALKEMLNYKQNTGETDANINVYNSSIKGIIDNFYEKKLSSTAKTFLDNSATFCNDRSVSAINGWNPTGGSTTDYLRFNQYSTNTKNLSCTNVTDRFSTENEDAKLNYPIGLLSEPERGLMNSYYAKTGQYYWDLSPIYWSYHYAYVGYVTALGGSNTYYVRYSYGVRPSVTLVPDVEITGVGTYDNPYKIVGSN